MQTKQEMLETPIIRAISTMLGHSSYGYFEDQQICMIIGTIFLHGVMPFWKNNSCSLLRHNLISLVAIYLAKVTQALA